MGFDVAQASRVIYSAVQRAIFDRLRMTKPELAGDALGLERGASWCANTRLPSSRSSSARSRSAGRARRAAG
eukprot:7043803-Alexandrium_andersonii.AAC.1